MSTAFAHKIAGMPPEAWTAATPCAGWTVTDLVDHVVSAPSMHFELAGKSLQPGPPVNEDALGAFHSVREQVQAELDDPARANVEFEGAFGRSTFADAVDRFVTFDLAVHGWDLARATGQDETIDPAEVARLWETAREFGDAIRSDGVCGPAVEPPTNADEQERLLAYLGRRT